MYRIALKQFPHDCVLIKHTSCHRITVPITNPLQFENYSASLTQRKPSVAERS